MLQLRPASQQGELLALWWLCQTHAMGRGRALVAG